MKITDMFYNLLMEQVENKKLLKFCLAKWYGNEPTKKEEENAENFVSKFLEIKPKLNEKNAGVKVFLNNYPNFDIQKIKNVEHYTIKEIEFLLGEFFDFEMSTEKATQFPEIFNKEIYDNETYKESKKLWYSKNEYLVVDEGDFRVYKMDRREVARNFGYYDRHLVTNVPPYNTHPDNNTWCIGRIFSNNMWSSYRDRRSFYFVIDESKNPEIEKSLNINKYYLSVLQPATDTQTKFRLTPILNDGSDPAVSEEQIFAIYPKLRGNLDKIKFIPYNEKYEIGTVKDVDIINLINEFITSPYEFAKQNKGIRTRFVERGMILTKSRSWEVLDEEQKKKYINFTNERNMYERFGTKELLNHIKTIKQDFKSIDSKIKFFGLRAGFNALLSKLLSTDFIVDIKKSLKGDGVSLYKSRTSGKYGLYDKINATWLEKNGIIYDDEYIESDDINDFDVADINEDQIFHVTLYKKPTGIDNTAFYFLSPIDDEHGYGGYFLSESKWKLLKESLNMRDEKEDYETEFDGDNEDHADLNELEF